ADQTTKVKGMFVHPGQVADAMKRHPEVRRARLVVSGDEKGDVMTLHAEVPDGTDSTIAQHLAESLQATTKLRGAVQLAAPGTLPNDGKVIEDTRKLG